MFGKLEEEKGSEEPKKEEEKPFNIVMPPPAEPELRTIAVFGDINEEQSKDVVSGLWYLRANAKVKEPVDPDDPETEFKEVIQHRHIQSFPKSPRPRNEQSIW